MAYDLSPTTKERLDAGRIVDRGLILFDLPSGFYGFWTGAGPFVYGGITYVGAGSLIEVSAVSQVTDGSAVPVTVRLSAVDQSPLTPDVLITIESEAYHQRPVTIMTAYFDPVSGDLLSVEREYRGYIDQIVHEEQPGKPYTLLCNLESKARDYLKIGYLKRSDAVQRLIDVNDGSLVYAAFAGTQNVFWGKKVPSKIVPVAPQPVQRTP